MENTKESGKELSSNLNKNRVLLLKCCFIVGGNRALLQKSPEIGLFYTRARKYER